MAFTIRYDVEQMAVDMAEAGLSGATLAAKAGVTRQTVYRYLRGPSRTAKTTKKLAEALGYDVSRYIIKPKRLRGVA